MLRTGAGDLAEGLCCAQALGTYATACCPTVAIKRHGLSLWLCRDMHWQCSLNAIAPIYGTIGILAPMIVKEIEEVSN